MDDLYLTSKFTSEILKTASKRISTNPAEWSKQVIEYFYDQYPKAIGSPIHIQFKERDPKKGYAVGSVRIGDFFIPVIIKSFVLFPMDVAIRSDGVLIPFNNDVVNMATSTGSPFASLDTRKSTSVWGVFDRALSYAGGVPDPRVGVKTASILEQIPLSINGKKKISEIIKTDPMVALSYQQNEDALQILGKVARLPSCDDQDVTDTIRRNYPRDISYLYKVGNCEWERIIGSSEIDDPVVVKVPEEKTLSLPKIETAPRTKLAHKSPNRDLDGITIPFHDSRTLFITKTGEYAIINTSKSKNIGDVDIHTAYPNPGDFGTFVTEKKDGSYEVMCEPFSIRKVASTPMSMRIEATSSLFPTTFEVLRSKGDKINPDGDIYYVPGNSKFLKLGKKLDVNKLEFAVGYNSNYIHAHSGDAYTWRGPVLEKYGEIHKISGERSKTETIWALIQLGADNETIDAFEKLGTGQRLYVNDDLHLVPKIEKLAQSVRDSFDLGKFNGDYWVKLAAWMPSPESVDAVLSLNFLNQKTINNFIAVIPLFEEAAHELARLLIAIRMGLRNTDEAPVIDALQSLSSILSMLHGAKNSKKING